MLDQQNKTFSATIEENKLRLTEMRQSLDHHASIEENTSYGIISTFLFFIIGLGFIFLFYRLRQFENYFNQRNTSKTEMELMTPIEIIERRREYKENDNRPLLNF